MILYCYPKCSTCQKAKAWLETQGISYEERHIQENPPTAEQLHMWHTASGLPLKRFFNTSGRVYQALHLKERLASMSEEEQYALLASDGMLIKRPLLIAEDGACPGFREADWQRLLKR